MIVLHIIIIILLLCIWHDTMAVFDNQTKLAKMLLIIAEALEQMEDTQERSE